MFRNDRARIFDKLDAFERRLTDHERTDSQDHQKLAGEMATVTTKVEGIESSVETIKQSITKMANSAESQNLEHRVSTLETAEADRKELRKVIRDRAIWILTPLVLLGFALLLLESAQIIDVIPATEQVQSK